MRLGSPPPMRGKAGSLSARAASLRITPAHAGKSGTAGRTRRHAVDHPRPCGEKPSVHQAPSVQPGSPPPMRGKESIGLWCTRNTGITPAHAGKSENGSIVSETPQDHPRPCGEKVTVRHAERRVRGSPPPMRGKAINGWDDTTIVGITPAHAGKSWPQSDIHRRTGDHPRPCGEKTLHIRAPISNKGSPPPMRGKEATARTIDVDRRITPAHAGKSLIHGVP